MFKIRLVLFKIKGGTQFHIWRNTHGCQRSLVNGCADKNIPFLVKGYQILVEKIKSATEIMTNNLC